MNFRVGINQIGDGPDIQTENRFRISLGYQNTTAGSGICPNIRADMPDIRHPTDYKILCLAFAEYLVAVDPADFI